MGEKTRPFTPWYDVWEHRCHHLIQVCVAHTLPTGGVTPRSHSGKRAGLIFKIPAFLWVGLSHWEWLNMEPLQIKYKFQGSLVVSSSFCLLTGTTTNNLRWILEPTIQGKEQRRAFLGQLLLAPAALLLDSLCPANRISLEAILWTQVFTTCPPSA